ncbi:hypothetical protein LCGC14_2740000 [marine sediment metagenome]|uniref:Uncharacterized protein n=1 Tax=marine sediment metagenome TaxID=412755 RepID=A0A0F9BDN8_9ZZZZ
MRHSGRPTMARTPAGLCQCGCGQRTAIPTKSNPSNGRVRGRPMRFVRGHHLRCGQRHPRWNGGRQHHNGYVLVLAPDHPHANHKGYVREHILLAVQALGRPLPPRAVVHHVDGNSFRNTNDNLVLCENQAYHMLLEYRTKAYCACGNAKAMKCTFCKKWDRPEKMYVSPTGRRSGVKAYHRACCRKQYRASKRNG